MKKSLQPELTASDIALALALIRASRERAIAALKAKQAVNNNQK